MPLTLVLLALGLLGSILMFAGDMLLYFTPGAYDMDGTLKPYMRIMRDVPAGRVRVGGALGPVSAFFYVLGFAGLALTARGEMARLAGRGAARPCPHLRRRLSRSVRLSLRHRQGRARRTV